MSSSYNTYDKVSSLDWNGDVFILTMRNELTSTFTYAYSRDGITWTNGSLPASLTTKNPYSAKWLGDKYYITGNLVSSALDASSGATILTNSLVNFKDISNTSIVPIPTGTVVYDIENNLEYRNRIVFPKSTILALGGSSTDSVKIAYSLDQGNSWTASSNSASVFTSSVYGSVWNGRVWVAVGTGGNTIGTSLDGNVWTGRGASILSTTANAVDWSKQLNLFVAVGSGTNTIATSMDGIYWLGRGNTIFSSGNDVKWNGNIWVAVGTPIDANNKSIAYSYDGVTWSTPSQGNLFSISGIKVAWNGSSWIAIGSDSAGNNVGTSVDGVNWKIFTDASLSYTMKAIYANSNTTIVCTSSLVGSLPAPSTWSFSQNSAISLSPFTVSCNYNCLLYTSPSPRDS